MITITDAARQEVARYFNGKAPSPIRIFISSGCGGEQLSMALDETKADDAVFTYDGVDYIMDTGLLARAQPVEVDFTGMGFAISSSLELDGGSCGSCGGGSCGC